MDFTKFVAMLETQSLFFARANRLGDPFEGSYFHFNSEHHELLEHVREITPERHLEIRSARAKFNRWFRSWVMVSCWHMNDAESAAMWKLYAQTNEAIAVQSTFDRLCAVLPANYSVGMVEYIDYESAWWPTSNMLYPFFHKRLSFSHEREVRAIGLQDLPSTAGAIDMDEAPSDSGIECRVDLGQLIEKIYVAPTSPLWFKKLVEQICRRYDVGKPIVQSSLDELPQFF